MNCLQGGFCYVHLGLKEIKGRCGGKVGLLTYIEVVVQIDIERYSEFQRCYVVPAIIP